MRWGGMPAALLSAGGTGGRAVLPRPLLPLRLLKLRPTAAVPVHEHACSSLIRLALRSPTAPRPCPCAVWAVHEQVCVAALDIGNSGLAYSLIKNINAKFPDSTRASRLTVGGCQGLAGGWRAGGRFPATMPWAELCLRPPAAAARRRRCCWHRCCRLLPLIFKPHHRPPSNTPETPSTHTTLQATTEFSVHYKPAHLGPHTPTPHQLALCASLHTDSLGALIHKGTQTHVCRRCLWSSAGTMGGLSSYTRRSWRSAHRTRSYSSAWWVAGFRCRAGSGQLGSSSSSTATSSSSSSSGAALLAVGCARS